VQGQTLVVAVEPLADRRIGVTARRGLDEEVAALAVFFMCDEACVELP
jgi:hypothetical protein